MAEGKTSMFGKTYNTIGSTDSNFIIKTKGDLKIQWGNKYIDLIKNGKVASSGGGFIKLVSSEEEVIGTGVFIVQKEEDSQVWVSVDGTKVNVTDVDQTMYVSYLEEETQQEESKKHQALRNIGFYYTTMDEAIAAKLTSGIIYIEDQQGLYLIQNGQIIEYKATTISNSSPGKEETSQEPLYIKGNSLWVNNVQYVSCEDEYVKIHKKMLLEDGLQSRDATANEGYRLYMENGNSILEIDYLRVRYPEIIEDPDWEQYPLFTPKNNIIDSAESSEDEQHIIATLVEYNTYEPDEYIYVLLDLNLITDYVNYVFTIKLSRTSVKDTVIKVIYQDDNDNEIVNEVVIPAGQLEGGIGIPENIIPQLIYDYNKELKEYKIVAVDNQTITIEIPENERIEFLNSAHYTYLARSPFLHIDKNTLYNLDRSKMVIDKETREEKPDDYPHTIIGDVKEEEMEILQEPEDPLEEFITPDVGLYTDKLLGLNPTLYNATFKTVRKDPETEHPYYPKYFEEVKLPEEKLVLDKKFNYIIPDMEWIKRMLDFFFPVGTIIMFNGQSEIPPGWVICDGNNGTPNLIDRFIKGGTGVQENNPEGVSLENGTNKFTIEERHLPYHTHPQQPHTHSIPTLYGYTDNSGSLTVWGNALTGSSSESAITSVSGEGVSASSGYSGDNTYGGTVTSTGGDHSHSITINSSQTGEATSYDDSKHWPNEKITVEPQSYTLIFIMKIKTFVDFVNEG